MDSKFIKTFQFKLGFFIFFLSLFVLIYNAVKIFIILQAGPLEYLQFSFPLFFSLTIGLISALRRSEIMRFFQVLLIFLNAIFTMQGYMNPTDLTGEAIAILGVYICVHYGWFLRHFYLKIIFAIVSISFTKLIIILTKMDFFTTFYKKSELSVIYSFLAQFVVIFTIIILLWMMTRERIQDYINKGKGIEDRFRQNSMFIDIGKIVWGFLHDLGHLNYSLADIRLLKKSLEKSLEDDQWSREKTKWAIEQASRIEDMLVAVDNKQEQIKKMIKTKHVLHKERIEINDMISNLIGYLKITYNLKNVDLNIILSRQKIHIFASPFEILQAIENIIRNSIEAMIENKGTTLTIETTIEAHRFAKILIEDSGGGIKFIEKDGKVDVSKFQIGRTTKQEKGTGWGMYSAVANISHNSGQLHIRTRKKVGTVFEILFELDGGKT